LDPLDLVGSTVGDEYHVEDVATRGELSIVYRVRSLANQRVFALKCFLGLAQLREPDRSLVRANLKRIGRLVASLSERYPGYVVVHRTGSVKTKQEHDVPAMLLEWLEGTTMEALLDGDRDNGFISRSPAEALELMRAPMAALASAHQFGIVHRNVKPGKLFVCGDTLVAPTPIKLLDFSLAKFGPTLTRRGMPGGFEPITFFTPDYAAPEQFRGEEFSIGPWTDVFALALVLVELMLGGRPALRGDSLDALRAASEDPTERPTPRAHGLELPNAVESVFKRALAVEPRDRFHSAGDFLQALERSIVCEGRLTSTHISRVSGVLNYQPSEDTNRRRHPHTPADGLPATDSLPIVAQTNTGDTVVTPGAGPQTGDTVIAPRPNFGQTGPGDS
jgi:serine/threonine protein kinase